MKILHCFQWKLNDIREHLPRIKVQGFDTVLTSPLQPHKMTDHGEWFFLYQPYSFSAGNDIGTKEQLINLCRNAKELGITIMVDVVCNHTANAGGGELSLVPDKLVDEQLRNNKYFWKERKQITDWDNRWQLHNYCIGLPGLRTDNWDLQGIIINFLNNLIECGVGAFRFDAARHIGTWQEGCDFFPRIINNLNKEVFCVGEVLNCPKWELDMYADQHKNMKVLTNVSNGDHSKKVVFAESHDTFLNTDGNGYTRHLSEDIIVSDYIELCKQYGNVLYYSRPYSNMWKDSKIKYANTL